MLVIEKDLNYKQFNQAANHTIRGKIKPELTYNDMLTRFEDTHTKTNKDETLKLNSSVRLLENVSDALFVVNAQGLIGFINPACERLFGWNQDQILTKNFWALPINHNLQSELNRVMETGEEWKGRYFDKQHGVLNAKIFPLQKDLYHAADYGVIINNAENGSQTERNKMETLGRLAGGVAHDFSNLLTVMIGFTDLMLSDMDAEDPNYDNMVQVIKSGQYAQDLIRHIMSFVRNKNIEPVPMSFDHIINDISGILNRLMDDDIHMEINTSAQPHIIRADKGQLVQIILNLVTNARDAIRSAKNNPGEKELIIETKLSKIDQIQAAKYREGQVGTFATLTVRDTGTGMKSDIMDNIFDPLFTTKQEGQGTGLGLATIYNIVKQNDGFIHIESSLKTGSVFQIFWPIYQGAYKPSGPIKEHLMNEQTSKTVMIVEDDAPVCAFTKAALVELGYNTYAATTAIQALDIIKTEKPKLDLIILDLVMPDMNGKQLAAQIKQYQPDTPILFTSGYSEHMVNEDGNIQNHPNFISKPYSVLALAQNIRNLIKK